MYLNLILNLALLLFGIVLLVYGVKGKMKFFLFVGIFLVAFACFSTGMDFLMGGAGAADHHRLAFVIGNMMH